METTSGHADASDGEDTVLRVYLAVPMLQATAALYAIEFFELDVRKLLCVGVNGWGPAEVHE